ncbi:thioredoxin domain-containing protein [Novosphingobium sp.]|uniref:DsbA family protein n=1 Tax=Novosphingobium sp. TaxID=1874826 RepID=UPI001ED7C131|nr:thioredoxin domain-containing protein [Novosphingobium sp.]MBK6800786.1 thioredoxin domain-containing protein [Novosphingobium sp.]MBK9011344.1 thioredoxin domain-containing protein [Novosphingobium sp.]
MTRPILALAFAALSAMLPLAAAPAAAKQPAPAAKAPPPVQSPAQPVARTAEGGYLIGNPGAPVKVVEFVSYTCPHCAHFHAESATPLQAKYITPAHISLEVRPFLRNAIDVTATLLTNCGPADRFYGNHSLVLQRQAEWLRSPNPAQLKRWEHPDFATRTKAMAQDLGLYRLMQTRGYKPAELDRCLSDRAAAERLADQTETAVDRIGVRGTPSFTINGTLQNFYDWASLRAALDALTEGFS